jgi:hypothetical protein
MYVFSPSQLAVFSWFSCPEAIMGGSGWLHLAWGRSKEPPKAMQETWLANDVLSDS